MTKYHKRRFLDTYKKVKKSFVRPGFYWFFGPWRKNPNSPFWRRGNTICLAKFEEYSCKYVYSKLVACEWTELGKRNHPILSRLFKPLYILPLWLSFYYFNTDVQYKTKWTEDNFCYESAPNITLVFFGYSISVSAGLPKNKHFRCHIEDYWESILSYIYYNGDLKAVNEAIGAYIEYLNPNTENIIWGFDSEFLSNKIEKEALIKIQSQSISKLSDKYNNINYE